MYYMHLQHKLDTCCYILFNEDCIVAHRPSSLISNFIGFMVYKKDYNFILIRKFIRKIITLQKCELAVEAKNSLIGPAIF